MFKNIINCNKEKMYKTYLQGNINVLFLFTYLFKLLI